MSTLISMTWRQSWSVSFPSKRRKIKLDVFINSYRNGRCCPRKYLKSCNTILSKTVHRYPFLQYHNYLSFDMLRLVNSDSQAFIKRFQPEISSQVSPVLKNYVSM